MSPASLLRERVEKAAAVLRKRSPLRPRVAVILGTGLGRLAGEIREPTRVPYADVPGLVAPTVETHAGEVVLGSLAGLPAVCFQGRLHFYEGHSLEQITFPVRVARELGAEILVVSGASGGMNPQHDRGDLLLIEDHVNFMGVNPLIGPNDEALGPRFPDMAAPYDRDLLARLERIAIAEGIRAHRGVYVAVAGPNLETRAEYRLLRAIGADVVGMSVVPEVLVGVHAGLRVVGLAVITDLCLPDALKPAKIEEIIEVANAAEPKMTRLVSRLCGELAQR
ncbi:MAG: purine-nucleoside phosphorylase [Planctomycetales bacterium]|nr:purine-nucleoside phosphorylase [Planctomycetales bacterium]